MSAAARPSFTAVEGSTAGGYVLKGPVVLSTVTRLREQMLTVLQAASGDCRVDVSGVTPVDSSGLALFVDLLAWSRAAGRTLQFVAPTTAILALARISEVESLLAA